MWHANNHAHVFGDIDFSRIQCYNVSYAPVIQLEVELCVSQYSKIMTELLTVRSCHTHYNMSNALTTGILQKAALRRSNVFF